jgi:pimeloyl-ACP methyl ester carboxylesterase
LIRECIRGNRARSYRLIPTRQNSFIVAVGASAYAAHACVDTWLTDFRGELPKIDVPTLLVHGTAGPDPAV